jgi:hypothetical protein
MRGEKGEGPAMRTWTKGSVVVTGVVLATTVILGSQLARTAPLARTASCPSRYVITASVGPTEPMYTQGELARQHPRMGEVMIRGQMASSGMSGGTGMASGSPGAMNPKGGMGAGATAPPLAHLEVHIDSGPRRSAVADVNPVITMTDTTAGGRPQNVPVAVMEGIGSDGKPVPATLHYGNNVPMTPGHAVTVGVAVGCDTQTFHLTAPAAAGTSMPAPPGSNRAPAPAAPPATGSSAAAMPGTGVVTDGRLPLAAGAAGLGALLGVAVRRRRRVVRVSTPTSIDLRDWR